MRLPSNPIVSNCPYLLGKLQAKIYRFTNSILKAILGLKSPQICRKSALELHVAFLDPAKFAHDLAEQE